jgi:hypothetical protein
VEICDWPLFCSGNPCASGVTLPSLSYYVDLERAGFEFYNALRMAFPEGYVIDPCAGIDLLISFCCHVEFVSSHTSPRLYCDLSCGIHRDRHLLGAYHLARREVQAPCERAIILRRVSQVSPLKPGVYACTPRMFDGFEVKVLTDLIFPNRLLVAANCAVSILSPESDLSPQDPGLKSETWATRPLQGK